MELEITTPAVLFPALSLLLLAYTNRFITLSGLIRQMNVCAGNEYELNQLRNLSKRMNYIKKMQYFGVSSLLFCVITLLILFLKWFLIAKISFVLSLLLMISSLFYSLKEIKISLDALKIHLNHCEYDEE